MSIKSILVYLSQKDRAEAVLDVAMGFASRHDAHLAGLHVISGTGEDDVPGMPDKAEALERVFRKRSEKAGVAHEWSCTDGDPERVVALQSRCHDLLVVGQTNPASESPIWPHQSLEKILIHSGRPVVLVPYQGRFAKVGNRVLIGWDGTREAGRAVSNAMPFLEKAQEAIVLVVDLRRGDALSVDDLVSCLEHHGVNVEARGARSQGRAIGDMLLSESQDLDCDLLVMGAYGHSRLREHVFGGPTYDVLKHMSVPVLMSH
jgi:nucleotide-binding universal stress UspA family protein